MVKTWAAKDPDEQLDFTYDWSADLETGETITAAGSSFVPINASGTVVVDGPEYGPDFVTVVIGGGDEGADASFTMRVATTAGRILEDTILLPIRSTVVPVPYPGGYVAPTAANLLCVFPEFSSVSEPTIQAYLTRAARSVDATWTEGDFGEARMYLAAHLMTLAGLGDTPQASAVKNGSAEFRSMAIGSLRLDRFDAAKNDSSNLQATRYGREFKRLRRQNRSGPRTTGIARGFDWSDGDKAW